LTRTRRHPPIASIENDTLPERSRLAQQANELAVSNSTACRWLPDSCVHQLHHTSHGQIEVQLSSDDAPTHTETVDQVIVQTGFRPDQTLYEELHVHECYVSQGPMKLAANLIATRSPDCMALPASGADALLNPEPHLFIIGSKSYGRDSRFLIRTGLEQIRTVMSLLEKREDQR
jgi:hypothetical protein